MSAMYSCEELTAQVIAQCFMQAKEVLSIGGSVVASKKGDFRYLGRGMTHYFLNDCRFQSSIAMLRA